MPLGRAKFHVNRCNESPLQGENADFGPVSKFNTGSLQFCGILTVNIAMSRHKMYLIFDYCHGISRNLKKCAAELGEIFRGKNGGRTY